MPPKRGNAKSKAENVVASEVAPDSTASEVPAKKRAGKAVKAVEEKPVVESKEDIKNNGEEEPAKNGSSKRGRKAKEIGNGEPKTENIESEVPSESSKSDEEQKETKAPAKRGRKPKDSGADKPPASKKTKASEEEEVEPECSAEDAPKITEEKDEDGVDEVIPKSKRGRKPAEKKESEAKAEPKAKNTKGKKAKEVEVEEPADDEAAAEPETEEAEPESKLPAKRGRGASKKEKAPSKDEGESDEPAEKVTTKKRGANKAENEPAAKRKATKPLLNKASTDYTNNDFSCSRTTSSGKPWNFKISSWNVDGIRAWASKGGLEYINHEKPDILCLQETKCSRDKLPSEVATVPGYHPYWLSGEQEGYAGVGIYTKKMAITVTYGLGDPALDDEGRIITAEYEQFYLICTYVPNAGRGLVTLPKRLQWNEIFRKYIKSLDAKKPVIICGDMNVSHLEIDLANPKTNKKNAGFTKEERDGMTDLLADGFVDTFRNLYPDQTASYTFWTYMSNCRAKNVGWRLDYAIVSERLMPAVCDNVIRSQVFGSDHCPITLFLHLNGMEKLTEES